MRFCDKLSKQRKENNLSQEQLADKLGVSRQAVSKWESGSSYPDMDKIMQMCKILNCTLEDLLDDGTIKGTSSSNKFNFNNYLQDFLNFITKVSNMFGSMKWKEKIKCIIEMTFIVGLIFIIGYIVLLMSISLTISILDIFPYQIGTVMQNILFNAYVIILVILGFIIVLHLFKIRYLDYFVTIEDQNVLTKVIEEPIEKKENKFYVEKPKEKIIIRDPKHSPFIFHLLGKLIIISFKGLIILFMIPILFLFIAFIVMVVVSLYHIIYGVLFFYLALTFIGVALIGYIIISFAYKFIFNQEIPFKKMFHLFMIGLVTIGFGIGLTFSTCLSYKHVKGTEGFTLENYTEHLEMNENTILNISYIGDEVEYKIDNSLSEIKLEITVPEGIKYHIEESKDKYHYYFIWTEGYEFYDVYDIIMNDLKNKVIRDWQTSDNYKITIYLSQKNYDILQNNYNKR